MWVQFRAKQSTRESNAMTSNYGLRQMKVLGAIPAIALAVYLAGCGATENDSTSALETPTGFVASSIDERAYQEALEALGTLQPSNAVPYSTHDEAVRELGWTPLTVSADGFELDNARGYIESFVAGARIRQFYYVGDLGRDVLLIVQGPRGTLPDLPEREPDITEALGSFDVAFWKEGSKTFALLPTDRSANGERVFVYIYGADDDLDTVRRLIMGLN